MQQKIAFFIFFSLFVLLIDLYVYQGVKSVVSNSSLQTKRWVFWSFWGFTAYMVASLAVTAIAGQENMSRGVRTFFTTAFFVVYFSKLLVVIVLGLNDLFRLGYWASHKLAPKTLLTGPESLGRSAFLSQLGFFIGSIPLASMIYGVAKGAYNYQVKKVKVKLPNLPKSFHGLRVVQISDIHVGSFFDKQAVQRGVDLLLAQKPDVVFFTGDLVNNVADEITDYLDVFSKVKAPMGVYSILGNHDYGDYVGWPTKEAKQANLNKLMGYHKQMGWDLLIDENRILEKDGEKIGVLGVQNWGAKGRFPKYGDLKKAYEGAEELPVKILLSHDPSHWEAQVIKLFPDIDLMLAGHTHGMQFGVEAWGMKWSPVQYMYKQWAGLYEQGKQYLYVNRGFGFIGFPGRVGIFPEITVLELEANA